MSELIIRQESAKDTNVLTKDFISRADATSIPVLPKEYREYQTFNLDDAYEQGWYDLQKCIETLPSAEPKTGKCKNCTHWDKLDYEAPRQGWCYQFEEFTDADEYCSRCAMMRGESHE